MRYHHYLYEHEHRTRLPLDSLLAEKGALAGHLQALWDNRPRLPHFRDDAGGPANTEQKYIEFHHERTGRVTISARNYVGQIVIGEHTLHLLPKAFYRDGGPLSAEAAPGLAPLEEGADMPPLLLAELGAIHANLFWWLSYSHRLRFPKSLASFASLPTSLLEVQILLFAQYTHELLSRSHFQQYQEVSEDLNTLRGHVHFGAYATNYATGRGHYLPCTYDSFQADNLFNRILKSVAGRLLTHTRQPDSQRLLQEIHFLLDEAADYSATLADCGRVQLSPLFDDFRVVLDYCRLFLADCGPLAAHTEEVRVFAVLLPTEVIFEDFVAGFVSEHLSNGFAVRPQASGLYLAEVVSVGGRPERVFRLKHDLLLQPVAGPASAAIVVDTKYKLVTPDETGAVNPDEVAQADMYQLVSYAIRRGTINTHLFYPDSLPHLAPTTASTPLCYEVADCLQTPAKRIRVSAHRLPVVVSQAFEPAARPEEFADFLDSQEATLVERLNWILAVG